MYKILFSASKIHYSNHVKNTEGYDRIPQIIIIDGLGALSKPLTKLFELVYREKKVPGQWLIDFVPND